VSLISWVGTPLLSIIETVARQKDRFACLGEPLPVWEECQHRYGGHAACHTCCFVSETSCEKANRFLDRRFLLDLPTSNGPTVPGFFGSIHGI
jgi:hypothetical protein